MTHGHPRQRTLGDEIRRRRTALDLSPAQLAAHAGEPVTLIYKLEEGHVNLPLHAAIRLPEALGCRLRDLVDLPDEHTNPVTATGSGRRPHAPAGAA